MRFSTLTLGALMLAAATPALAQVDGTTPPATTPGPENTQSNQAATVAAPDSATSAPKAFTLTGSVVGITDYRFRGLTQTGGDPALQTSVNLNTAVGFYVGFWASTIDGGRRSRTPLLAGYGSEEVDLFGGFTKAYHGVGIDAGLLYYYYPNALKNQNTDFFEPYASLSYTFGPLAAKVGGNYAWGGQKGLDFRPNNSDANLYLYAEGSIGIPKTPLTLKGHYGRTKGSLGLANLDANDDEYYDWSGTIEAVGGPIKVGASYVDTDITHFGRYDRTFGRGKTVLAYVGVSF